MRVYVRLTCGDDSFNVEQSVMHIYFTMVLYVYMMSLLLFMFVFGRLRRRRSF